MWALLCMWLIQVRRGHFASIPEKPESVLALTPEFSSSLIHQTSRRKLSLVIKSFGRNAAELKKSRDPGTLYVVNENLKSFKQGVVESTGSEFHSTSMMQLDVDDHVEEEEPRDEIAAPPAAPAAALRFLSRVKQSKNMNEWEKLTLTLWMGVLKSEAGLTALKIQENPSDRARRYLVDAHNFPDRHVLKSLIVEGLGLGSYIPEKYRDRCPFLLQYILSARTLYYAQTSRLFRVIVFAAIFGHIALSLWEAPEFDNSKPNYYSEYGTRFFVINGLCTFWHVIDIVLYLIVFGFFKYSNPLRSAGRRISKMTVLRCCVVLCMTADYLELLATSYVTKRFYLFYIKDKNAYENTLLPWSAPLRGVLLIIRHSDLQTAFAAFFVSVMKGKDFIIVALSFLTMTVCVGLTLFPNIYDNSHKTLNFSNFRSAYLTMFDLVFTGDNYPDAIYPTLSNYNRFLRLFFILAAFVGTYMLVAMIIATFQRTYRLHFDSIEERSKLAHRTAMVAAFIVLRQAQLKTQSPGVDLCAVYEDDILHMDGDVHTEFYVSCGAPHPDRYYREIEIEVELDGQQQSTSSLQLETKNPEAKIQPRSLSEQQSPTTLQLETKNPEAKIDSEPKSLSEDQSATSQQLEAKNPEEKIYGDSQSLRKLEMERSSNSPLHNPSPISNPNPILNPNPNPNPNAYPRPRLRPESTRMTPTSMRPSLGERSFSTNSQSRGLSIFAVDSESPPKHYAFEGESREERIGLGLGLGLSTQQAHRTVSSPLFEYDSSGVRLDALPGPSAWTSLEKSRSPLHKKSNWEKLREMRGKVLAASQVEPKRGFDLHPTPRVIIKKLPWGISDWSDHGVTVLQFVSWLEYLTYKDLIKFKLVFQRSYLRAQHQHWLEGPGAARMLRRYTISGALRQEVKIPGWSRLVSGERCLRDFVWKLIYSRFMKHLTRVMVVLNILFVLMLGSTLATSSLRSFMHTFIFFNFIETGLRVYAEGITSFLFKDHPDDLFRKYGHQWDLAITLIGIIVYGVVRGTHYYQPSGAGGDGEYVGDIIFSVPVLRLVTILRTNRVIVFGMMTVLRGILPLLALLVVVIYIWGILGVFLFSGLFQFMPSSDYSYTETNFNSITAAMTSLFQAMLTQNWTEIMRMAVDTEYSYEASLYFVTYIVMISVLFGPLFIGLMCDAYVTLLKELHRADEFNKSTKEDIARDAANEDDEISPWWSPRGDLENQPPNPNPNPNPNATSPEVGPRRGSFLGPEPDDISLSERSASTAGHDTVALVSSETIRRRQFGRPTDLMGRQLSDLQIQPQKRRSSSSM